MVVLRIVPIFCETIKERYRTWYFAEKFEQLFGELPCERHEWECRSRHRDTNRSVKYHERHEPYARRVPPRGHNSYTYVFSACAPGYLLNREQFRAGVVAFWILMIWSDSHPRLMNHRTERSASVCSPMFPAYRYGMPAPSTIQTGSRLSPILFAIRNAFSHRRPPSGSGMGITVSLPNAIGTTNHCCSATRHLLSESCYVTVEEHVVAS